MTFTVTFPSFPVYGTGSGQYTGTSFIIQLFLFIVQVIAYPFEYVFEGIGNGIGAGFQTMFSGLFSMVSTVYTNSEGAFSWAGPFAPILVSIVWGASFVILVFFVIFAFHMVFQDVQEDTGT